MESTHALGDAQRKPGKGWRSVFLTKLDFPAQVRTLHSVKPSLLLVALFSFGLAVSHGQSPSQIAVVDMIVVFKAHPKTAVAESTLEKKQKAAREVFVEKKKELEEILRKHQSVTQKLVTAGSSATSSDKGLAKTYLEEASKVEKEIATLRTTQATDLKNEYVRERRQIMNDITEAIATFNGDGNYALVLDRSAESANGIPQVLHAPGVKDITAEIVSLVKAAKP
tara:strand:+ start:4738 stop:5412 length:675 start_codon:yes stop_codon:yes gene_type:complete